MVHQTILAVPKCRLRDAHTRVALQLRAAASRSQRVTQLLECTEFLLHTPFAPVSELRSESGRGSLLCLRDDLVCHPRQPLVSGSKARKLDALLPKLVASGVRDVVTCGGLHSCHLGAVASGCALAGLRAHLLVRGEQPVTLTGHALAARMFATSLRFVSRREYADLDVLLAREAQRCGGAAVVPEGAACVDGVLGVLRGLNACCQPGGVICGESPTLLCVDAGTGCSAFGLALGCALLGLPWRVLAVPVGGGVADIRSRVERLAVAWADAHPHLACASSALPLAWAPAPAARFGECSAADVDACAALARTTGVLADPVWTVHAYRAACAAADDGAGKEQVVWVHTGGALGALDGAAQRYGQSHFGVRTVELDAMR